MTQYEYLVVDFDGARRAERERLLNVDGLKGWELVSAGSYWAYLKRPIALLLDEKGFWVQAEEEVERPEPPPPPPPAKREEGK